MKNSLDLELRLRTLFLSSMGGNKSDYELFLKLVSGVVKRSLSSLGRRSTPADVLEEILQETLLKIHLKKHTYFPDKPILPWLYAITKYGFLDHYRQAKKGMKDVPFDEEFYTTPVEEVTFDLEEILVGLTPGQRELLLMTKIEGYSYQEASTKLKISIPSAKVGVHRIVETLKKRFEK